jgi:hypothetical protein
MVVATSAGYEGTEIGATVPSATGTAGATVPGTDGTAGATLGVTNCGRTVPLTASGAVVTSRKGMAVGTAVSGGRVEFDFSGSRVAASALDPLLVGTGVAVFEELIEGIGVGTEGTGVATEGIVVGTEGATEDIGDPDVLLRLEVGERGDDVKLVKLGDVVEGADMLLGDVVAIALLLLPGEVVPAIVDVDGDAGADKLLGDEEPGC